MLQIGRCVTELCRFYGRTAIFQLNNYNFSLSIFLPSLISYGKTEPITTFSGKVSRTVKLHWYWLRKSDSTKCFQQRSHTCFRKFSDCECIDQVILSHSMDSKDGLNFQKRNICVHLVYVIDWNNCNGIEIEIDAIDALSILHMLFYQIQILDFKCSKQAYIFVLYRLDRERSWLEYVHVQCAHCAVHIISAWVDTKSHITIRKI